jgi:hypothetical protein
MFAYRSSERKRRQVYRSELNGQLPFNVLGMEEPVPELEFSTSGGKEDPAYSIDREDIEGQRTLLSSPCFSLSNQHAHRSHACLERHGAVCAE